MQTWRKLYDILKPRRKVLALGLMVMVVNRLAGLVLPGSTKYLLDSVIAPRHYDLIGRVIWVVLAATSIQGISSFLLTRLVARTSQELIASLRERVQRHIGQLPISFHDSHKTGALVSRIMNDVEGLRNLLGSGLIDFVGGLLTALVAFAALLSISPAITGIAAAIVVVFALILRYALRAVQPMFRQRGEINAELTGRLAESLSGVRVVKGYRAEEQEARVFERGSQKLLGSVARAISAVGFVQTSATVLMGTAAVVIMYAGTRQIANGTLTIGAFGAFIMFLVFLISPMIQIVSLGTQFGEALAGLERTSEVLALPAEDSDPSRTEELPGIIGHVEFHQVEFGYDAAGPVLHDISFDARPGSVTALVGSSGSGKSTITSLIAAFHKPQKGAVFVDGVDLSSVRLQSYRTQIGLVLQETFLFGGTIRENILFARPNATQAEFRHACRVARVDEFADRLEAGYDTIVGERGVKLSGGQKQRVAIARAILTDPRILILDEATSSLDSESEALIQEGLHYLMEGRTTFVIAHRLATIRRATQILVIEQGRVVESGLHDELFRARRRYYDLYMRQHGVEANLFFPPGEPDPAAGGDQLDLGILTNSIAEEVIPTRRPLRTS